MKKPAPKKAAKSSSPDNIIAYAAVALVMFVASAAVVWLYLYTPPAPAATYTKVGPVSFRVDNRSARVTLDLQSMHNDSNWAKQNYGALETVIESVLSDTDPALMSAPNDVKLPTLQKRLAQAINKNFPEAKVDQVYVTDFVSSQD